MNLAFMLSQDEWNILGLSMAVGILSSVTCLPAAVYTAWILARKNFPGKLLFEVFLHLPLVLPPVVVGYLLLILFGKNGFLGGLLNHLFAVEIAFHFPAAVLASAVVGFPLMLRAIRLSFETVDPKLEEAARTLKAGPAKVFWQVSLPLALPGIRAGLILGFARSLSEFGATMIVAGNIPGQTQTLPLAIYGALQMPGGEDKAMRLSLVSIAIAFASLLLGEVFAKAQRKNSHA